MKIAIIDYDAGNLANVVRAATRAGLDVVVTRDPEEIREAKAMILPGVGAMKDAMDHLSGYGLTDIIREEVRKGKKLAGICLGMQALYEVSEEGGEVPALGLLPGRIVHFPEGNLKVPHMGWNELVMHRPHEVLAGLPEKSYVYFVHSYYKTPGGQRRHHRFRRLRRHRACRRRKRQCIGIPVSSRKIRPHRT